MKTTFANVKIGQRIRSENCYGVKVDAKPEDAPESVRKFYAGSVPGYPGRAEFWGWNFRYQFMGHGEFNFMSLSPETEVETLFIETEAADCDEPDIAYQINEVAHQQRND